MSNELLLTIIGSLLNLVILPIVIYFIKSVLSRIDKISSNLDIVCGKIENISIRVSVIESNLEQVDIIDERLDNIVQRLTVVETSCQLHHKNKSNK